MSDLSQRTERNAGALQAAIEATARAMRGTNRRVDEEPRPAAQDKRVAVICPSLISATTKVPSEAAIEAAHAAGWQTDLHDAGLDPSKYEPLVRQAVEDGVDGIILDAIDAWTVEEPLLEALARGIAVVPIYAFDRDDPHSTSMSKDPLFSAWTNYGVGFEDHASQARAYGADQANYIVAATNDSAKIIAFHDPEVTIIQYVLDGFRETIEASAGSEILSVFAPTVGQLMSGQLNDLVDAEVRAFPEVNWVKSPYSFITMVGLVPTLGERAGTTISIMGGEGFEPELDLIREGKVAAVNVIASDWAGWAAVDTLNSVFIGQPPADSGIGWTIADPTHNMPSAGEFPPPVDFRAAYRRAWGV